jgi:hypothetical protein
MIADIIPSFGLSSIRTALCQRGFDHALRAPLVGLSISFIMGRGRLFGMMPGGMSR